MSLNTKLTAMAQSMQKLEGPPEPIKDMKFDKGKLLANIPFEDFPLAIKELIKVCTFGAQKYSRSSWKTVSNAEQRYNDARARHFLETGVDEESELYHLAHEAWNCLALLQMKLEKEQANS